MKRYLFLLVALMIGVGITNSVSAQKLSKEEKKAAKKEKKLWKKKAKTYAKSPLNLRDDLETANKKLRECSEKNKSLQDKYADMQSKMDSVSAILSSRDSELAAIGRKYEKLEAAYQAQKNVNDKGIVPGLVYRCQVGAYVHFDMNQHLNNTDKTFEGENKDGMNKYMMGNFRGMENAVSFRDDIRKLGIDDAWIVPYIDGTRISKEEAEAYLSKQGK